MLPLVAFFRCHPLKGKLFSPSNYPYSIGIIEIPMLLNRTSLQLLLPKPFKVARIEISRAKTLGHNRLKLLFIATRFQLRPLSIKFPEKYMIVSINNQKLKAP